MDADIEKAIAALKAEVAELRTELVTTRRNIGKIQRTVNLHDAVLSKNGISDLKKSVDRLILLVDGDDSRDVEGLRRRLETVEEKANEIINQRNTLKWILMGMGLTGITNLGALITVIVKTLGGGP